MESAKTKKSYPENSEEAREFVLFDSTHADIFRQQDQEPETAAGSSFRLGRSLFENLQADPDFSKAFEEAVKAETDKRIQNMHQNLLERAMEEAHKKGYAEGISKAEENGRIQIAVLEEAARKLSSEKHQLLHSHEKLWMSALKRTLECFGFPNTKPAVESIESWLRSCLRDYEDHKEILVLVDLDTFSSLSTLRVDKIEIKADPGLQNGQIIVKLSDRELFFSPDQQWKQLTDLISQFVP